MEQLPAIVYSENVSDDGLQVVYINPRVGDVLGITPEEWIADPSVWQRSLHPDDVDAVLAENDRTEATGEPFEIEYRMIARDGRVVWFHDVATLVRDADGEPAFWQGVMTDITPRKLAEERIAEAEGAADRLREADEIKNTFLRAVSHDLRGSARRDPRAGEHARAGGHLAARRGRARPRVAHRRERSQARPHRHRPTRPRPLGTWRAHRLAGAARRRRHRARAGGGVRGRRRPPARPRHRPAHDPRGRRDGRAHRRQPATERRPPHARRLTDLGARRAHGRRGPARGGGRWSGRAARRSPSRSSKPSGRGRGAQPRPRAWASGSPSWRGSPRLHGGRAWVEDRPGGGASFRVFLSGSADVSQPAAEALR